MKLFALALTALLPCLAASSAVTAPGNFRGNSYGNPSAPIRIEVFSDFQCPGCKELHDNTLPQVMRDFVIPGKVYLIDRYFPLQGHPFGRESAEFVCAASRIGKYDEVSNAVFAQQQVWSMNGKLEEAVDSVLTPAEAKKVRALTHDPGVQAEIARDVLKGRAIPVLSTPTLLITYKQKKWPISGVSDYSLLKSFLNGILAK